MTDGLILPTEQEVRNLAFGLFKARGGQDGWDVADWVMAERAARFHKNYERVLLYHFDTDDRTMLGTAPGQSCRFCGRSAPAVSFRQVKHAVPELLGNRSIFVQYECDDCNQFFGRVLEDSLGKMLSGVRTLLLMRGKRGIPSFKTNRKLTRIDVEDGVLKIQQSTSDPIVTVDQEANSAAFNPTTQPFTPLAVYKCFARLGLSLMPESVVAHYSATNNWIREPDHTIDAATFSNAFAFRATTPGPLPDRYGWVELYKRRHESLRIPYIVMVLVSKNITFQTYIPLGDLDQHLSDQQVTIPRFPAGINCGYEFGETTFVNMRLSSPTPITADVSVNLQGGDMRRSLAQD